MKEIVNKYLEGHATKSEMNELLVWLRNKENRLVFRRYKLDWSNDSKKTGFPAESREDWLFVQEQMAEKNYKKVRQMKNLNMVFRIAAIFFFVTALSVSMLYMMNKPAITPEYYTTLMAEKGQIAKLELPDGSLVWLNSGSSIRYSNHFAITGRDLHLSGEAFIEAAKNSELPMVVDCGDMQVKVVGTRFNVAAYTESGTVDVVLESGVVQLLSKRAESFGYQMKPGERARFNTSNQELAVSEVNPSRYTSWKEGIINIYNQPLAEVVERLELRYNQKFSVDSKIKDIRYTFTIKNEPLEEILQLMEKITPVKAVQENDTITFKPDNKKMKKAGG